MEAGFWKNKVKPAEVGTLISRLFPLGNLEGRHVNDVMSTKNLLSHLTFVPRNATSRLRLRLEGRNESAITVSRVF